MYGIELSYRIGEISGYKCCYCGSHLGSKHDNDEYSDTGFEGYVFCPYCGKELYEE